MVTWPRSPTLDVLILDTYFIFPIYVFKIVYALGSPGVCQGGEEIHHVTYDEPPPIRAKKRVLPEFRGKDARILLNSHGTHGTLTTPQCVGFPHPPGVIRLAVEFWCMKRVMRDSGRSARRRYAPPYASVADLGGGRATLSFQSITPKFPEEPNFFPLHPPTFLGEGGETQFPEAVLRGSVLSVGSVADLGGGRATLSLQSLTPKFPEAPKKITVHIVTRT